MFEIELKQEHIEKGVKRSCDKCAFALAFQEIFPKKTISVTYHGKNNIVAIYVYTDKGKVTQYNNKVDLAEKLQNWDKGVAELIPGNYQFEEVR